MANIGPNSGQKLRWPLKSFTEMLIREARWVSGMTYEQLDEALSPPGSIWCGQTYRYAMEDRAPLASAIQGLEQRVADLTKRKARRIAVFEGNTRKFVGYPEEFNDLGRKRLTEQSLRVRFLFLAYEDGCRHFASTSIHAPPLRCHTHTWKVGPRRIREPSAFASYAPHNPADIQIHRESAKAKRCVRV